MVYYSFHQRATVQLLRFLKHYYTVVFFSFGAMQYQRIKAIIIHGKKFARALLLSRHNTHSPVLHDILEVLAGEVKVTISVIPSATVTVGSTARIFRLPHVVRKHWRVISFQRSTGW